MENNGEALAEEKPNYDTNDRPARRDTFPRTRYLIEQQCAHQPTGLLTGFFWSSKEK